LTLFRCANCSRSLESDSLSPTCGSCGSVVLVSGDSAPVQARESLEASPPGVWRYGSFLPDVLPRYLVTLGEGGTPLLKASRLGEELGLPNLMIKDETQNPTGSFIDRGATVLVSLAKQRGVRACSCRTTGNLGASLSAYCAKAGIAARVTITPSVDRGKLYQMIAFGADIETSSLSQRPPTQGPSLSVSAGNPFILEGEKTTCFEIAQDLRWTLPDVILVPIGTGGHISMTWRAIVQMRETRLLNRSACRLLGVQFRGVGRGSKEEVSVAELEESEPFFTKEAKRAIAASGGLTISTTASDAIRATGLLARTEGIFAELASSSAVAALKIAKSEGLVTPDDRVVCVITGTGLKDTKAISKLAKATRKIPVTDEYEVPRLQIGETKLAILLLLVDRPRYGYELWRDISLERKITTASIYQHLSELEDYGLARRARTVKSKGRERLIYEPTRKGEDFVEVAGKLERARSTEA
jgi:threonine synthase